MKKQPADPHALLVQGIKLQLKALKQMEAEAAAAASLPPPPPPQSLSTTCTTSTWMVTFTTACSGDCSCCYAIGIACVDRLPPKQATTLASA